MKKEDVLPIVFSCADAYLENLSGHTLLFICSDKHKNLYAVEVTFNASSFLHMTGLKTNNISAKDFLKRCKKRRLSTKDFNLDKSGFVEMKLKILPMLMHKNLSAKMIGNIYEYKPMLYTEKLAGNIQGCMGFKTDSKTGVYVPNTVIKDDIKNCVDHPDRIILTYRKKQNETFFSELVYTAKNIDWENIKLPKGYENLPLPKQEPNAE